MRAMTKILIIDDEKPIRNTLREILEYEKFKVDEAEDGLQGIEKSRKQTMISFYAISKCQRWTELRS